MMEYPKKKKRGGLSRRTLAVLVLVVLLTAGGLIYFAVIRPAGEALTEFGTQIAKSGSDARGYINSVTGGHLPDSADGIEIHGVEWMDYSYWIRFSLSPGNFEEWRQGA